MFHTLGAVKNAITGEDEPELRIETERQLVRDCDRIIATTEMGTEELTLHYGASPEKVVVIPCGVNFELFQPMEKDRAKKQLGFGDDSIILSVGRIEPLKGIDQLLRAMTYLRDGKAPRLVIVGGDDNSREEVKRLKKLASGLNIENSVTFLGMIEHERLPGFYNAASICVVASYYESFGLVALESMACGTPVVATDVGDLTNIVQEGETGYVVRDNSPHCLADKIALLLSRPDRVSAPAIRASVSRFSWSNIAQQVIKEFEKVLAGYSVQTH